MGDSMGAAIFALATEDGTSGSSQGRVDISGVNEKVAALLGTSADQILINDLAGHPISKAVYLSVSRGRGPDAIPLIVRVDSSGKIEEFSLANVKHAKVTLPNTPDPETKNRNGQSLRLEAITDLAFVDDRVFVAGLSMRSLPPSCTPSLFR